MKNNVKAFILAAGYGERLGPITEHIAKPLLPILGKPILQDVIGRVSAIPVNNICINLHHQKNVIKEYIKGLPLYGNITIFNEQTIYGTGGALKNAEKFINDNVFLVHNSDISSDIDLNKLLEDHFSSKNIATLAVHEHAPLNNIGIDKNGYLKGVKKYNEESEGLKWLAFTGIAVYNAEFLQYIPSGYFSVVDAWIRVIREGKRIGTLDVSGCYWNDIGTPSSYASTVFDRLRNEGESIYIHPSVSGCENADLGMFTVIENDCVIEQGVSLRNCIVLPGSHIRNSVCSNNCIIGMDFTIELSDKSFLNANEKAQLIGTGGSDRKYYRTEKCGKNAVIMESGDNAEDFKRYIEINNFFNKYSIPVPEIFEIEPDKSMVTIEDLGDITLNSWLKCKRGEIEIEEIYRKILDILINIHTELNKYISECPIIQNRVFDYKHLRWESSYFLERFVKGIKGKVIKNPSLLNNELHQLAKKTESLAKTVIHRDFQSQNIMITKGNAPRVIDYHGSRLGPPEYDVVSISWDPYYRLEDTLRDRLINYYIERIEDKLGKDRDKIEFSESLLLCRLQRHMQALGAYGFLSMVKNKKYFMKYIPEGLRLLKEDIMLKKDEYPALHEMIMEL